MPPIDQLRKMLDELEIKTDARNCLEHHGRRRYARRIPVERDLDQILRSLQDLIDSCTSVTEPPVACQDSPVNSSARGSQSVVRIQLKLSPDLVRVLQTVRKTQVRASDLVEAVLWSSPRIQDTAQLVGIRCPRQAPAA